METQLLREFEELVDRGADARHAELDDLARVKLPERSVVAAGEFDRSGDRQTAEMVGEQILAEARTVRRVEEVMTLAELRAQLVELRAGVQPADQATVRETGIAWSPNTTTLVFEAVEA